MHSILKGLLAAGAVGAVTSVAGGKWLRRMGWFSFTVKTVLKGGSRGLVLAREWENSQVCSPPI